MQSTKLVGFIFASVFAITFSSPAYSASQSPYESCHTCHGEKLEGNLEKAAPGLAGQIPSYLVRQLHNFQNSVRGTVEGDESGARMHGMTIMFSNEFLIRDVVAYIQTFPKPTPVSQLDGNAQLGKNDYLIICSACHGVNGEGNALPSAPSLTGIGDQYSLDQFEKFQLKQRGYEGTDVFALQMQLMSTIVTDKNQLKDIIAYIQTLTGKGDSK